MADLVFKGLAFLQSCIHMGSDENDLRKNDIDIYPAEKSNGPKLPQG